LLDINNQEIKIMKSYKIFYFCKCFLTLTLIADNPPTFSPTVQFPAAGATDGEKVNINIAKDQLMEGFKIVKWNITPEKVVNMENKSISISEENGSYSVLNARWFSDGKCGCNTSSTYEVTADYEYTIDGDVFSCTSKSGKLVVYAPLEASAFMTKWYSGDFQYEPQLKDGKYFVKVLPGDIKRDIVGGIDVSKVPVNSQFYDMIKAEEEFHVAQFDGSASELLDDLFDVASVVESLEDTIYVGDTAAEAYKKARKAVSLKMTQEYNRSLQEGDKRSCDLEEEAKSMLGNKFYLTYKCSYVETGGCGDE